MSKIVIDGKEVEAVVIINTEDLGQAGGGVQTNDGTVPPPTGGGPGEGTGGGTH